MFYWHFCCGRLSRNQNTVVSLYGVSKTQWSPCIAFFGVPGPKAIWGSIIFLNRGIKLTYSNPIWWACHRHHRKAVQNINLHTFSAQVASCHFWHTQTQFGGPATDTTEKHSRTSISTPFLPKLHQAISDILKSNLVGLPQTPQKSTPTQWSPCMAFLVFPGQRQSEVV